ncbi:DsbA family protein [Candidatus Pelagibacter sp.]|nr:DsbA family protein [Candidatus Pelagibacter sp.]
MSSHIDFYFDIISPYSYIAHKKIQKIKDIKFIYKPILLGGLHNLAEITAPAFNKYKMKNMQNDCELVSKKNQIDFTWNLKFPINTLNIMRGYLFVDKEKQENYVNTFFKAYWNDNLDLSNEEEFSKLLKKLEINQGQFIDGIKNQTIKDELKKLTNDALKKEVFGTPTFIVNDKIFWGQDRLEYALEELNGY